jgi:hypothetical protein
MENDANVLSGDFENPFTSEEPEINLIQEDNGSKPVNNEENSDRDLMSLYANKSGSIDNLITYDDLRRAYNKLDDMAAEAYLIIATTGNIDCNKVFREISGMHFTLEEPEGTLCTVQEINQTIQDMSTYNVPSDVAEINAFLQDLNPNIQLFQ